LVKLGENEIIGEFEEANGKVTGSFLTPSGDYRYFEGVVTTGNKLIISCFDGGFVRLFTAEMVSNDSLANVKMYSGFSTLEEGTTVRKEDATLPDAYAVTGLKKGYKTLGFSFPNLEGKAVNDCLFYICYRVVTISVILNTRSFTKVSHIKRTLASFEVSVPS